MVNFGLPGSCKCSSIKNTTFFQGFPGSANKSADHTSLLLQNTPSKKLPKTFGTRAQIEALALLYRFMPSKVLEHQKHDIFSTWPGPGRSSPPYFPEDGGQGCGAHLPPPPKHTLQKSSKIKKKQLRLKRSFSSIDPCPPFGERPYDIVKLRRPAERDASASF